MSKPIVKSGRLIDKSDVNFEKYQAVNKQVEEIKIIMHDNIEQAINRGIQLEDMQIKAEELNEQAVRFEGNSRSLKRLYCCKKYKAVGIVCGIMLILIGLIVLVIYANK